MNQRPAERKMITNIGPRLDVRREPIVFDNAKRPPTGGPPLENHVIAVIAMAVLVR